jgi:hypothetical protein
LQTIPDKSILNDINFWINIVISIISFIVVFIINGLKKDIGRLFERTENNSREIGIINKDLENHREECRRTHDKK